MDEEGGKGENRMTIRRELIDELLKECSDPKELLCFILFLLSDCLNKRCHHSSRYQDDTKIILGRSIMIAHIFIVYEVTEYGRRNAGISCIC